MDIALPLALGYLQQMHLTLDFTWRICGEYRRAALSHDTQEYATAAANIRREHRLMEQLVTAFFEDSYFSNVTIPGVLPFTVHDYGIVIRAVVNQPNLRLMIKWASVNRRWFRLAQAAILMEAYLDPMQVAIESLDRDYACHIYARDESAVLRIPFDVMTYLPVQLICSPQTAAI